MAAREQSPAERLSDDLGGMTAGIGTVSTCLGVTIDALRYYEAEGLLGDVERDAGGRRRYTRGNVLAVGVVHALRGAGFTMQDIREFVTIKRPGAAPAELVAAARSEIERLEAALDEREAAIAGARALLAEYRAEIDAAGL